MTVTLSSVGVIGGNQTAVTDDRGVYQFTRLVPGTYGVKAELLQGFRAAARQDIMVSADATVRSDLTMTVGDVSETITVSGDSPRSIRRRHSIKPCSIVPFSTRCPRATICGRLAGPSPASS